MSGRVIVEWFYGVTLHAHPSVHVQHLQQLHVLP